MNSDSTTLARRSSRGAADASAPSTAATSATSRAASHDAAHSHGGPGSTTITAPPARSTAPGAVPGGGSATAPAGSVACLRAPCSRISCDARAGTVAIAARTIARAPSSSCRGTPAASATASIVRSSWVGPSPPVITTRSTPDCSACATASRISSRPSPTTVMRFTVTPAAARDAATKAPFSSLTRPSSTSVPVTTSAARTA